MSWQTAYEEATVRKCLFSQCSLDYFAINVTFIFVTSSVLRDTLFFEKRSSIKLFQENLLSMALLDTSKHLRKLVTQQKGVL